MTNLNKRTDHLLATETVKLVSGNIISESAVENLRKIVSEKERLIAVQESHREKKPKEVTGKRPAWFNNDWDTWNTWKNTDAQHTEDIRKQSDLWGSAHAVKNIPFALIDNILLHKTLNSLTFEGTKQDALTHIQASLTPIIDKAVDIEIINLYKKYKESLDKLQGKI